MNNPTIKPMVAPFKKFCMSIGALPTSYKDSLDYYETLLWLIKYLENTIIPVVNNNSEAVTELQNLYIELKNYVEHYFDNLDVQEEIDNKLDNMVEQGTLQEIIADYLNSKAIFGFDNVASMKNSTNLIDGSYARTLGYYSIEDGGASLYKIRTRTFDDVIDNGSKISIGNNLVAILIPEKEISIYQFGAKGDGTTDDSTSIQNAVNYSINNGFMKIKGNITRKSAITKTIKLHAYNKVSELYLDVSINNLTNGFMISVNSNNVSTWDINYPDSTRGYLKNVKLENSNQIENINGIFNGANNRYERINTIKLNKSFYNIASYLDMVKIFNIQVDRKIGTDYAINLGYLGDACELNTAHMYGTIGTNNFITGFAGHNAITLKNIICNGNLYVNGGNVSIENIHSESGQITIDNAIVNISNGFFYHHNDPNITINNSYVKLNQLEFAYYTKLIDYTDSTDIDINITNSNVEINNCYKTVKSEDINEKITSYVKTNLDLFPSANDNKKYYKNNLRNLNDINCSFENNNRSINYPSTSEKVKWKLPSGTYYYKAIPIVDFDRKIRTVYYDGGANVELTNNNKGFRFSAADGGKWRIYRGTANNSYDSYVDIAICGDSVQDDGIMCNGFKWQSRTAGDIDSFDNIANGLIEYVKNNIRCSRSSLPTYGTWNKGDIIYNSNYNNDNQPYGWVCTVSGTPGTWKEI